MDHGGTSKALRPCSTNINFLPEELKCNILSRLSVKLLCSCKSVSKEWLGIISCPYFRALHLDRSKENYMLLLVDQFIEIDEDKDEEERDDYEFAHHIDLLNIEEDDYEEMGQFYYEASYSVNRYPMKQLVRITAMDLQGMTQYVFRMPVRGNFEMLPSNHGLVCFNNHGDFYIYNPSAQKFCNIPQASPSTCQEMNSSFGYLPSTKEYKLVHMYDRSFSLFSYDIGCEIYTLSATTTSPEVVTSQQPCWKQIKQACPYLVEGMGVLVNNAFYWLIWDERANSVNKLILSLNLEQEIFEVVRHPPVISYVTGIIQVHDVHLVELRGYLCLAGTYASPEVLDLWVLEDYKETMWVKEYSIDLSMLDGFNIQTAEITVLGYQNGEIIVDSGEEGLDFYNVRTKTFRRQNKMNLKDDTKLCLYTDCFY